MSFKITPMGKSAKGEFSRGELTSAVYWAGRRRYSLRCRHSIRWQKWGKVSGAVTLNGMDRERLGRALGYGARHAVKTLTQAVDAATSPDPRAASAGAASASPVRNLGESVVQAHRTAAETLKAVQATKSQVRGAAKQAGKSVLTPVAKFSSVLWLEVTGTFFALMAFAMGEGVYRLRTAFKLASRDPERMKLYGCVALAGLFLYFAVSNFVRAARRGRQ